MKYKLNYFFSSYFNFYYFSLINKKIMRISCFLLMVLVSCKPKQVIKNMQTETFEKISFRAIAIQHDTLWFAGSNGKFGWVNFNSNEKKISVNQYSNAELRSAYFYNNELYVLNIGNPAKLVGVSNLGLQKLYYSEENEKVFYDSMVIGPDGFGIAIGDPTATCLSILLTTNGGKEWNKIMCSNLPETVEGEAAFAASNTNVKLIGQTIYIVSGGKKSRLFKSVDKGKTWHIFNTPIVQGKQMTGVFSMDFYNEKIGVLVGGNYEEQQNNECNKAITFDGGITWKLIANKEAFGYASCVQFVPGKKGKELFVCGTSGVYYSKNFGATWKKILDDNDYYTLRIKDSKTLFLAGKNKITKLTLN